MSLRVRGAVLAAALALGAALAAALAATAVASAADGWWAAGYHRLFFAGVWPRFDRWAPLAAGGAALVAALVPRRAAGRGPGGSALVLLAAVLLPRALGALDAWRAGAGPNVVLISIDTLRADHLGAYGYTRPTTPALDRRLAAAGVLFEDVYSQSPKTTPSHMTLLTSLFPSVHGVELWEGDRPGHVLNPAVHTLAEVLKNAGYATAACTGGAHMDARRGFAQGFDRYTEEHELGHALTWIKKQRRRKFFLFFHTYQVHDPYVHPERWVELFDDTGYQGPLRDTMARLRGGTGAWDERHRVFWEGVERTDPRAVAFVTSLYDAGIRRMDAETLAPLLDRLEEFGLTRDTLVVFTSDHGEAFAEHGAFLHDDLYAGTLRVPLVLRWPARLPAGVRVPARVRSIDVMPTILALLDIPAPPQVQGRSLVPLLTDASARGPGDVASEYSVPGRVYESFRHADRSYIADGATERVLAAPPADARDVTGEEPATLAAMRTALARWHDACRPLAARYGPRAGTVRPGTDTLHRLRALGYVQ
jgi:arylsulfatase A-like enzyme